MVCIMKNITFNIKLFVGIFIILLSTILFIIFGTMYEVKKGLYDFGKASLIDISNSMYNSLMIQNDSTLNKLKINIELFELMFKSNGEVHVDVNDTEDVSIINSSEMKMKIKLPKLYSGSTLINNNFDIVDSIKSTTGVLATIFQYYDNKLIRISTNVVDMTNKRAIHTYLDTSSPVYQSVMRGETYRGKAFVVDTWYLTTYKPIRDQNNNIVSVLFVGERIITPKLEEIFRNTKAVEVGYFFVYDGSGTIIIHPDDKIRGKNIYELPGIGPLFKNHKEGILEYTWNNESKITQVKYFKEWDWYLSVGLSDSQLTRGIDSSIIFTNIMISIGCIFIGLLFGLILVKSIAKPLKKLAEQSLKIAEGDYTIRCDYTAKDSIGLLNDSLNNMIDKTKLILSDISNASHTLASSSSELAAISEQMTSNTKDTTKMSDLVNKNSIDVSTNMNSVSAAMEETSINMATVATAAEEMSATISEISQNTERARYTTETAVNQSNDISNRIQSLHKAAQEINVVTTTIAAISSQTNLLALNATIEAARAGSSGKGFAVVANEIKELAQQTSNATENIKAKIFSIQDETKKTIEEITNISNVISEINMITNTISTAVEEQSVTTKDIAMNINQASSGVNEINSNVANSASMTRSITSEMGKVRLSCNEMTISSETVQTSASDLSRLAETLNSLISKFKIK